MLTHNESIELCVCVAMVETEASNGNGRNKMSVCHFTYLNANMRPISGRLLFVNNNHGKSRPF